jgi:hypothetical protein
MVEMIKTISTLKLTGDRNSRKTISDTNVLQQKRLQFERRRRGFVKEIEGNDDIEEVLIIFFLFLQLFYFLICLVRK